MSIKVLSVDQIFSEVLLNTLVIGGFSSETASNAESLSMSWRHFFAAQSLQTQENGEVLVELDMLFTPEQWAELQQE